MALKFTDLTVTSTVSNSDLVLLHQNGLDVTVQVGTIGSAIEADFGTLGFSIIPAVNGYADQGTGVSLGGPNNFFAHVYADEVHVGPHSLYVNGKQVVSDNSNVMTFSTEIDESMLLKATATVAGAGTGNIGIQTDGMTTVTSQGDIDFTVGGNVAGKNINFTNSSVGGAINFYGNSNVTGNFSVTGNLTVTGTTTTINTVQMSIEENLITLNSNQTDTPANSLVSGIVINRGQLPQYRFEYEEASQSFSVGQIGSLQRVATRENTPLDGGIPTWSASNVQFITQAPGTAFNASFGGNGAASTVAYSDHNHDTVYATYAEGQLALTALQATAYTPLSAVLTGYASTTGAVAATDTIISAIEKLSGNLAATTITANAANTTASAALPATSYTPLATALTGFSSTVGTISGTDTILTAINKLNGNLAIGGTGAVLTGFVNTTGAVTSSDTILSALEKLSGDVTAATTTANAALPSASYLPTAAVLAGYNSITGTVLASDSILSAIEKLNGNLAVASATASAALPASSYTPIAAVLTGYNSITGTITATDTVISAIEKLNGNMATAGIGAPLTGFSASAGVVATTDTVLTAFDKIVGNLTAVTTTANNALPSASYQPLNIQLSGFSPAAGTVAATDRIIDAFDKIVGNLTAVTATANAALPAAGGVISGNLSVGGNLTISGTTTTINTTQVNIADNFIQLNSNQTGVPAGSLTSGITVNRGSQTAYQFDYQESNQTFRVGQVGSTQAVATREDTPVSGGVPTWNATSLMFTTAAAGTAFNASFGGNGSATTVSHSDHNHDTVYATLAQGVLAAAALPASGGTGTNMNFVTNAYAGTTFSSSSAGPNSVVSVTIDSLTTSNGILLNVGADGKRGMAVNITANSTGILINGNGNNGSVGVALSSYGIGINLNQSAISNGIQISGTAGTGVGISVSNSGTGTGISVSNTGTGIPLLVSGQGAVLPSLTVASTATAQEGLMYFFNNAGVYTLQAYMNGGWRTFTSGSPLTAALSGYASTTGTISSADTVLGAIEKLNGNMATAGIGAPLTGFSASAGTVAATDTVLVAFNKVVGNIAAVTTTANAALPASSYVPLNTALTGYASTTGTITTADTVLGAIEKLNGNMAATTTTANSAIQPAGLIAALNTANPATQGRYVICGQGTTFPVSPGFADEFYRTDLDEWFKYNGAVFTQI